MMERTHRSWEEDALINDAHDEDFSLNNLAIFQENLSSQVVESETQTVVPLDNTQNEFISQPEQPDKGTSLNNFHYPPFAHFSKR